MVVRRRRPDRYQPADDDAFCVLCYWRRQVGSGTAHRYVDTADVLLEIELAAYQAVQSFDPRRGVKMSSHVYSACRRAWLQAYRHYGIARRDGRCLELSPLTDEIAEVRGADDAGFAAVDLWDSARACLQQREYLVLDRYYRGDLFDREIAESMGLSEARVHQIRHEALVKLRGEL